jgi:hypothetical protein
MKYVWIYFAYELGNEVDITPFSEWHVAIGWLKQEYKGKHVEIGPEDIRRSVYVDQVKHGYLQRFEVVTRA